MDIAVLGPCQVTHGGVPVVPTAVKPRKLLALLALQPNQVVSVAAMVEELWDGAPPRSMLTTLQTYVLQIRNLIAAALAVCPREDLPLGPKSVLTTQAGGYLLDTQGGFDDVAEFERMAASGHRAMATGDCATAAARFRQALGLWRGPALVDVQLGQLLEVEVTRLEEARMTVLGRRIEADLRLGRHHEILGELAGLAARHPTQEGLQAQYILSLYRAGRRSGALEAYNRVRTLLKEELGLDPSPELRQLHTAMLSSDPGLEYDASEPAPRAGFLRVLRAG